MRAAITVAALLSKEVQYVASLGSSVRVALRGAPVKVVTVSLTAPFFSLVSRPNIRTVQDLRDKEIGITGNPGSTNDQVVRMILRQAGLDPQRDVKLLHLGDPPVLYSAFKGGRFAAISVSLPFPVVAEQEGYKILANAAESIKLPFIGLAVSDETLRSSQEQVKRMIRADVEARRYIGREKDETIDVMMRWLGLSRSVALRSYELVRPAISQDFNLDRAGIQKLIDMESEHGERTENHRPRSNYRFQGARRGEARRLVARRSTLVWSQGSASLPGSTCGVSDPEDSDAGFLADDQPVVTPTIEKCGGLRV